MCGRSRSRGGRRSSASEAASGSPRRGRFSRPRWTSTRTASTRASGARLRVDPARAGPRSSSCGCSAATPAASASPYPDEVVRATMLLRANALATGHSGARVETVELLLACARRAACTRACPARGSVGASGDLAPLAHLALRSSARARPWSTASCSPAPRRSRAAGLAPLALEAKEGLTLINGTQHMTAMAALALVRAAPAGAAPPTSRARCRSRRSRAPRARFDERDRRRAAAPRAAREPRRTCARCSTGSAIAESHRDCGKVQDPYSLRCMPQVHGATRDLLDCRAHRRSSANAVTDNPLVFVDGGADRLGRQLPRPAGRDRARLPRDRGRRAREHQRAAHRAARQPAPVDGLPPFLVRATAGSTRAS